MSDTEKNLSAETSPNTVNLKKQARRLNNRPMLIGLIVATVVILTLGMVMVQRGNAHRAGIAVITSRAATDRAREFTSGAEGGIIAAKEPEPPPPPEPPPMKEEKPNITPRVPELPRESDEARRFREKRIRQLEAALDGPIKAQVEDTKIKPRSIEAEIAEVERRIAALSGQGGNAYADRLAAAKAAAEGGSTEADYSNRGDLSRMNQFGSVGGNWKNAAEVEAPPANLCVVRTGSVIPATLVSGINSDLPGQIVGQVAQDVYDTPTGKYLLIPQGSRLIGEYSSQVKYGQSRVFAVWQRVVFPDGKALDLGAMPGSSGAGYAGFRDRVNNHYARIFGSAVMMSAILAGVEMTQNKQDYTNGGNQQRMSDALSESLGQVLGGVMAEMLSKNMSIAPTLEIRPGYRFNVMLVKDLEFKHPYQSFDYRQE